MVRPRLMVGLLASLALVFGLATTPTAGPIAEAATRSITLDGVKGTWSAGYRTVIWGKANVTKATTRWVQVQRQSGRKWVAVANVRVGSGKAYNWRATITAPNKSGTYKYRVRLLSSRNGRVWATSATKAVRVRPAPRVYRSITDGQVGTWMLHNFDADGYWDALANDADHNGIYEDVYLDSDVDPRHLSFDVHAYNTVGSDSMLEQLLLDRNHDGFYDVWYYDTNQIVGFDGWLIDADFDRAWDQPSVSVTSPEPLGILGDFGAASVHTGGYFEPCGRTNCQRPGL